MPGEERILRVVGAAILDGGTCLVAQRGADGGSAALKWEFPGGKVEPDEEPRAALRREIREELSLEIEVGSWLGRGRHSDGGQTVELDVFAARIVAGEIVLAQHRRCGWFSATEIGALDWAEADRPILSALGQLLIAAAEH